RRDTLDQSTHLLGEFTVWAVLDPLSSPVPDGPPMDSTGSTGPDLADRVGQGFPLTGRLRAASGEGRISMLVCRSMGVALALFLSTPHVGRVEAGITFLGAGMVPGDASDLSGLTGNYADNPDFPKDRLGAFGSAIAYTGQGNLYVMTNDRGYAD